MQSAGDSATALKLKNKVCATEEKPIKSTMELFDKFISEYAEIVEANNYGTEALLRYKVTKSRVQEFFEKELKAKDLPSTRLPKGSSTASTFGSGASTRWATTRPSSSSTSSQRCTRWHGTTAGSRVTPSTFST